MVPGCGVRKTNVLFTPSSIIFEHTFLRVVMEFILKIRCGNSAFEDDAGAEVARILRILADKLEAERISLHTSP